MKRAPKPLSLLLAGMALVVLIGGCTARDAEKALYTGAKIAYDSFKFSNNSSRP